MMGLLNAQGIEVSAGSACNATQAAPSPVLLAMGTGEALAASSLRFSLAHLGTPDKSTQDEIEIGAAAVIEAYASLSLLAAD